MAVSGFVTLLSFRTSGVRMGHSFSFSKPSSCLSFPSLYQLINDAELSYSWGNPEVIIKIFQSIKIQAEKLVIAFVKSLTSQLVNFYPE